MQEWCIDEKKTGCGNQRRQRNSTGDRAAFAASKNEEIETHLVYTRGAEITAAQESELSMEEICALADVVYDNKDIGAVIADA